MKIAITIIPGSELVRIIAMKCLKLIILFFCIALTTCSDTPLSPEVSKGFMDALYKLFDVYKGLLGGYEPPNWKELADGSQGLTPAQIWNHGFLVYKAFFQVANSKNLYCDDNFRKQITAAIGTFFSEAEKYFDKDHIPLRTTFNQELKNLSQDCSCPPP